MSQCQDNDATKYQCNVWVVGGTCRVLEWAWSQWCNVLILERFQMISQFSSLQISIVDGGILTLWSVLPIYAQTKMLGGHIIFPKEWFRKEFVNKKRKHHSLLFRPMPLLLVLQFPHKTPDSFGACGYQTSTLGYLQPSTAKACPWFKYQ